MWPFSRQSPAEPGEQPAAEPVAGPSPAEIAQALPDPVLVLGRDGFVTAANDHARAVIENDPQGHHISASIRSPAVLEAVQEVMATGTPVTVDYELRVPLERSFQAHVAPLGRAGGAVIVLRDLTREQQIERMRADFVANASHELRTPLASLSGFIETLQGAARNDEKAQVRFLGLMRSQADRMKRLIDDLLSLSRIEMNEHVRPSDEVDLVQVAHHVRDVLSGMAQELECEIRVTASGSIHVPGSRDELVQVVQNLTENALKYASSGKLIEIAIDKRDAAAELSVRDHGPGIAPQHLPRLTERFYRVNVQESRSRGGTGLGLAIVKHILNRHRGA